MNKLICLDANISGWVFRDNSPEVGIEAEYKRANQLCKLLSQNGYYFIIPSIVLSELFCKFTESEQVHRFKKIQEKNILFCGFDFQTSMILSRILHHRYFVESKAYQDLDITKRKMKYDAIILACAVQQGASCLYTTDGDLKKYDESFIPIKGLNDLPPEMEELGGLFDEEQVQ